LADKQSKVIFGGWLGEYKYYDMSQVFEVSLERCRVEVGVIKYHPQGIVKIITIPWGCLFVKKLELFYR